MGLEIRTTPAQIGIERIPSNLEIQTQAARLELHQKQAKINIHTELPQIRIDQSECFSSAGLKNDLDWARELADRGRQQVMETIAKKVADGETLAAIERGGNAIAEIAKKNAYPEHEFGLDFLPKVGPKFDVIADQRIEPEDNSAGVNNGVEGDFTPGILQINYTMAKVNINIKQYGSVDINYMGNNLDERV